MKRGVGPFRDPKHRPQERVRSARRSGQSAVSPDKVGATSTDTKSTDFDIHHPSPSCAGFRLGLHARVRDRAQRPSHVVADYHIIASLSSLILLVACSFVALVLECILFARLGEDVYFRVASPRMERRRVGERITGFIRHAEADRRRRAASRRKWGTSGMAEKVQQCGGAGHFGGRRTPYNAASVRSA